MPSCTASPASGWSEWMIASAVPRTGYLVRGVTVPAKRDPPAFESWSLALPAKSRSAAKVPEASWLKLPKFNRVVVMTPGPPGLRVPALFSVPLLMYSVLPL
ncbi:hypothetical protein D9M72_261080 [compost metagenome]